MAWMNILNTLMLNFHQILSLKKITNLICTCTSCTCVCSVVVMYTLLFIFYIYFRVKLGHPTPGTQFTHSRQPTPP